MPLWIIYAFLATVSAAFVGVFSKIGIKGIDASVATSIRGFVIAISMGIVALCYGKWETLSNTGGKAICFIVLAGLFGGLSWLWGFLALQAGGEVTAVNAIDRMSIILVLIFAIFFLGEHFSWQKFFGVFLVSLGVMLATISREQFVNLFKQLF